MCVRAGDVNRYAYDAVASYDVTCVDCITKHLWLSASASGAVAGLAFAGALVVRMQPVAESTD